MALATLTTLQTWAYLSRAIGLQCRARWDGRYFTYCITSSQKQNMNVQRMANSIYWYDARRTVGTSPHAHETATDIDDGVVCSTEI